MTKIRELHRRWSNDRDHKDAYAALGEEFDLARALIEARTAAGLTQSQLARRMKTSQSYIARIEGGKLRPSTETLERFAQATRTRLRILFDPQVSRYLQHGSARLGPVGCKRRLDCRQRPRATVDILRRACLPKLTQVGRRE
jgi:transcriptional regulator with XRE-family HTH domain